jgi:plastocyanin
MRRWLSLILGPVAVLAVLLVGCGGDDDTSSPDGGEGSEDAVTVVAEDIGFAEDAYESGAGTVAFEYRNEGALLHTLVIEGIDDFELEVPGSGDEDAGTVELEAGSYTLFCDVAGHREAGMEATLEVR